MKVRIGAALVLALLFSSGRSQAAPVYYFGEDGAHSAPGGHTNSDAKRDEFLLDLGGGGLTYGFENEPAALTYLTSGSTFDFGGIEATLTDLDGTCDPLNGATPCAAINSSTDHTTWHGISDPKYLHADNGLSFELSFDQLLRGIGFYATDVNDWQDGDLELTFYNGSTLVSGLDYALQGNPTEGNVVYFGVIIDSAALAFDRIRFTNNSGFRDSIGFDDFTIAAVPPNPAPDPDPVVPEPSSMLLLGTGVAALARRRFKRAE